MKSIGCSQTRTSLAESDRVTDLVKGSRRLPGALALEEIVAARSRFRRLIDEASDIELSARLCDPRGRTSTASSDAAPVRGVPPSGPPVDCGPVYVIGTPKGRTTCGWHRSTANSTFGGQH